MKIWVLSALLSFPVTAWAQDPPAFEPAPDAPVPAEVAPAPEPIAAPVAPPTPVSRKKSVPAPVAVAAPASPWAIWVVLGGLAALALGITHFLGKKKRLGGEGEQIQIVAKRALSPKHQLILVTVRQRELLLAIGDHGTTLLTEVGNTAEVMEAAENLADDFEPEAELPPEPKSAPKRAQSAPSPAVSGLLALKARMEKPLEVSSVAKNSAPTLERDTEFGRRLTAQMLSGRKL